MTPARRTPLTLLAALLLGAILGLLATGEKLPLSSSVPAAAVGAGNDAPPVPPPGMKSSSARPPSESSSGAYSAAWELLKDRPLPREERRALEDAVIKEWCVIDLKAALRAAFAEVGSPYFGDEDDPFVTHPNPPFEACQDAIGQQLDLTWELVVSQEYGLNTRKLRECWITFVGLQSPLKLLEHFAMLPAEPWNGGLGPRDGAVRLAMHQSFDKSADPKLVDAVMAKLEEFATQFDRKQIISNAAMAFPMGLPEERHLELLRGATTPVAREIHLKSYVAHLCRGLGLPIGHEVLDRIPVEYRIEARALLDLNEPASDR